MYPESTERDEIDICDLLDPALKREHLWAYGAPLLELWAAWMHRFREQGRLKEMLLRDVSEGNVEVLAVTVGVKPIEDIPPTEVVGSETSSSGGFLHFFPPFQIAEDMLVTSLLYRPQPWFAPSLAGFVGYPVRDPEDMQWHITYEQPIQLLAGAPLDRWTHERLHIDRFCTDYLLRHGRSPYESLERGSDPPDFMGLTDGKRLGIECTQLTVQERREAFGLFKRVRGGIVDAVGESRSRFAHLRGLAIYMRFQRGDGQEDLPPAATDSQAVSEIVEAFADFHPDIDALRTPGGAPPEQAPPLTIGTTSFGCSFHAAPLMNAMPDTPFFIATGFEMGFGLLSLHQPEAAWQQIVKAIGRKDKQGNDDLIITVGGPDREGYAFPSEELVADIALRLPVDPPPAKHLTRAWIHFWTTGRIVQILPERQNTVEVAYRGGLTPSHLSLGQPPEAAT